MTDILTQLQTCLDQLATQYYACVCYNLSRHSPLPPDSNPDPYSTIGTTQPLDPGDEDANEAVTRRPLRPEPTPEAFTANQTQLVRDLILKEQQIECLIKALPGIGTSELEQDEKIRRLAAELREVQGKKKQKRREMRRLRTEVEDVIVTVASRSGNGNGSDG